MIVKKKDRNNTIKRMKDKKIIISFVIIVLVIISAVAIVKDSITVQKKEHDLSVCYNSTIDSIPKHDTYKSIHQSDNIAVLTSTHYIPDFDSYYKHYPSFARCAKVIYIKAEEYGLPPFDIIAIAELESYYGTSYLAKHYKNYFGLGAVDWNPGGACNFSKYLLTDAIDRQVRIIKRDFYDKYHTTDLQIIGKHYCSKSTFWTRRVRELSSDMQNYFSEAKVK